MGQTISSALSGGISSNKRARDEDSNDTFPSSNDSKRVKVDDDGDDDSNGAVDNVNYKADKDDKEDGEISESEDAKPVNILQERLDKLKWQSKQASQHSVGHNPQVQLGVQVGADAGAQAVAQPQPYVQPQPLPNPQHLPHSHSHSTRYPYNTNLPNVPFTNYDVELVKSGLINGLSFEFLQQEGVDINLLNYSASLIHSTPSNTLEAGQSTRKPPKKGVNLEIFNQNKQLFQRDPKTLTKAERKERKRIARLTKNKVKDESDKRKNKRQTQAKPSTSKSSADEFLNSLALSPHSQSATSATSASLVEPPSQTFNASQKPHNIQTHTHSSKTPYLRSKPTEIIITPSDDDDDDDDEFENVDDTSKNLDSTRSMEKIPEWVVGRLAPIASTSTPTPPPPPMSLSQRAAQGDVKAQNELKRKENEIYEMQLKIKQMEIKREKQKLEAMMMGRMKGGVGSSISTKNTSSNTGNNFNDDTTITTSTYTQVESFAQEKLIETKKTKETKETIEVERLGGAEDVVEEPTDDAGDDTLNIKNLEDAPDAQEAFEMSSSFQDGDTGTNFASTNNTEFESVFEKNPSLLQYVEDFDDDDLRKTVRSQSKMFSERRMCKYELPLGGKCKDRE